MPKTTAARIVTLAVALAPALLMSTSVGHAASERVRAACKQEYLAYCSQHPSEGAAVRKCMDAHGAKLSKSCVDALVANGEVSRAEVERRKTAANR